MVIPAEIAGVTCATGKQGRSVVDALLAARRYVEVRALVRDASSDEARLLHQLGAVITVADMNDRASVTKALKGCTVVYGMTDSWDPDVVLSPEHEVTQGKMLADVCKSLGVYHLVWSSLDNTESISGGKFVLREFMNKNRVEAYMRRLDLPGFTCVFPGFYYQDFESCVKPKRAVDGTLEFRVNVFPQTRIPMFDVRDLGPLVAEIFAHPDKFHGVDVRIAAEELTMPEVARLWTEATGEPARFVQITSDEMALVNGKEMADMFRYCDEFGFFGGQPVTHPSRELHPNLHSFRKYVQEVGNTLVNAAIAVDVST